MKKELKFKITEEGGYYTASCSDFFIVTQGETWNELVFNIKEATELYFEDEDLEKLDVAPMPTIAINLKLEHALCRN